MSGENRLLNATLIIAVVTIISYGVTLVYQQAYYGAYDIDSTVFSLSLAPEMVLTAAIILMGVSLIGIFTYFYLKFTGRVIDILDKRVAPHFPIGMDIFSVMLVVGSILLLSRSEWLEMFKDFMDVPILNTMHYTWILAILSGIVTLYVGLKIYIVVSEYRKNRRLFKESYWLVSEELVPKISIPHLPFSIPLWVLPVLLVLVMLPVFPILVAQGIARDKVMFTELVQKSSSNPNIHQLVIGKTGGELIIKHYNSGTHAFQPGFSLVDSGSQDFRPYLIKK